MARRNSDIVKDVPGQFAGTDRETDAVGLYSLPSAEPRTTDTAAYEAVIERRRHPSYSGPDRRLPRR